MTTKERFDELMFATCPTEEKGPFLWRWEEGARKTLLTFIESEKKLAVEEERRRVIEMLTPLIGEYGVPEVITSLSLTNHKD